MAKHKLFCVLLGVCMVAMATSCVDDAFYSSTLTPSYSTPPDVTVKPPSFTTEWPLTTPADPNRTEPNPASDFLYTNNGTSVTITKYIGLDSDVVIPREIEGKSVTNIGEGAFKGCGNLTSLVMPDSVTRIGKGAFSFCSGLTSITIPQGVVSIGDEAFSLCSGLTSITIPQGVVSIGDEAFRGCSSLTMVSILGSSTSIGYGAFACGVILYNDFEKGVAWRDYYTCPDLTIICLPNS
ncbi:MAG: leucine-rich repeat domain-containing protein, partial [Dehalococcoidia bacterium]|nr:leucine-rich repeat domain-containing protein [Dehalococcoidia bacterium]